MSMKQELKALKRLRKMETRNLHMTYLRTKREIRQAVSPDRFIRSHLGASLGIAAVAGLLLAPRLGGHAKQKKRTGKKVGRWMRTLLAKVLPESWMQKLGGAPVAYETPEPEAAVELGAEHNGHEETYTSGKKTHGLMSKLLAEAALMLITKLDLPRLVNDMMHRKPRHDHPDSAEQPGPRVSVADAGSLKDDPFEEMQ